MWSLPSNNASTDVIPSTSKGSSPLVQCRSGRRVVLDLSMGGCRVWKHDSHAYRYSDSPSDSASPNAPSFISPARSCVGQRAHAFGVQFQELAERESKALTDSAAVVAPFRAGRFIESVEARPDALPKAIEVAQAVSCDSYLHRDGPPRRYGQDRNVSARCGSLL